MICEPVAIENNSQYKGFVDALSSLGLDRLALGQIGRVVGFGSGDPKLVAKLREVGFAEGDEVELLGRGWLGGAPLSIRLNRTVIALRKGEAALIQVELAA
jgi:ferrous iron transport protein A